MDALVDRADVVVVGAGHNGLVAATLLARAGLRVVVVEAADVVGGAARTERPFSNVPGLSQSTGAYLLGLMPPELPQLLRVEFPVLRRDPHYFLPTTGDRYLLFGADREATRRQYEEFFSASDWKADEALQGELDMLRSDLAPAWLAEPVSLEETAERYIRPQLRAVFVELCRGSVGEYLDRFGFTSDLVKAMYAVTDGLSGLDACWDTRGSGHNFLVGFLGFAGNCALRAPSRQGRGQSPTVAPPTARAKVKLRPVESGRIVPCEPRRELTRQRADRLRWWRWLAPGVRRTREPDSASLADRYRAFACANRSRPRGRRCHLVAPRASLPATGSGIFHVERHLDRPLLCATAVAAASTGAFRRDCPGATRLVPSHLLLRRSRLASRRCHAHRCCVATRTPNELTSTTRTLRSEPVLRSGNEADIKFLVHNMCRLPGSDGTWMVVRGGMGTVTAMLADTARAAGATIATRRPVVSIELSDDAASAVTCADDSSISAPTIVVATDPFRLRQLVGTPNLPASLNARLDSWKQYGTTMKVNLALRELPTFTCLPERRGQHGATIHLLPEEDVLQSLRTAYADVKAGKLADFPTIEWYIHTPIDPSLQDADGHHSSALFVEWVPYEIAGSSWDAERDRYVEKLLGICDRFAPGTSDLVADTFALAPPDLERHFGLTRGHIHHVDNAVAFADRMPYATGVPGLYAAGAGCHPAGSVIGAAGHNAAMRVLADLGLWPAPR